MLSRAGTRACDRGLVNAMAISKWLQSMKESIGQTDGSDIDSTILESTQYTGMPAFRSEDNSKGISKFLIAQISF